MTCAGLDRQVVILADKAGGIRSFPTGPERE
jgi:hypothetical protein